MKSLIFNKKKAAEDLLTKGYGLLENKLYKQATIVFDQAINKEKEFSHNALNNKLNTAYEEEKYEAVLSIGNALYNDNKKNYQLLVILGNCERKLENFDHANNFYNQAIKVDENDSTAFYNLAASLGEVDKYDLEIPQIINRYIPSRALIFPEPIAIEDPKLIKIRKEIIFKKRNSLKKDKIQELLLEKQLMIQKCELENVRDLNLKIKDNKQNESASNISKEELPVLLDKVISDNWSALSSDEKTSLGFDIYNHGIHHLKSNNIDQAAFYFDHIKDQEQRFFYLNMVMGLTDYLKSKTSQSLEKLKQFYLENPSDRFVNVNLGIIYGQLGDRLLSHKHLIMAAYLIEQLDGKIQLTRILKKGDELNKNGQLERALEFYHVAEKEHNSVDIWTKIGELNIDLGKYEMALMYFKKIFEVYPNSLIAKTNIKKIHDNLCDQAETYKENGEYRNATTYYKSALKAFPSLEVLEKIIHCYKALKRINEVYIYEQELLKLKQQIDNDAVEKERSKYVRLGKIALLEKNWETAIRNFEKAFLIRVDETTFKRLSYIYNKLNHKHALDKLRNRYQARKQTAV